MAKTIKTHSKPTRVLRIDRLEEKALPSFIFYYGTDVYIDGDYGNDIATVSRIGDQVRITATGATPLVAPFANVARIVYNGSDGRDTFVNATSIPCQASGGPGRDTLIGGTGDDTLRGDFDDDLLRGNGGNDSIEGGFGNDVCRGESGNDTILGESGLDKLYGDAGNDLIFGGDDADTIYGVTGDDTLHGEGGDDRIWASRGADVVFGDEGNDVLRGDADADTLVAGDGLDTVYGGSGNDQIAGDAGADVLYGEGDNDSVYGGDGRDTLWGDAGDDTLFGGPDEDYIDGGNGNDQVNGDAAYDILFGKQGNDTVSGGTEPDAIDGGPGDDVIYGNEGDDHIFGNTGNDQISGGSGGDWIFGNSGVDQLTGDEGDDWLDPGSRTEAVVETSGFDINPYRPVVDALSADDIKQRASPTCVFLSTLAGAVNQGYALDTRIVYRGNYTFQVRLFHPRTRTSYWETVEFDGRFKREDGTLARYYDSATLCYDPEPAANGEFWTALFQRAYLQVIRRMDENFRDAEFCQQAITGRRADTDDPDNFSALDVATMITDGKVITVGDADETAITEEHHSYTVVDIWNFDGVWTVRIRNPWGYDSDRIGQGDPDDGIIEMTWNDLVDRYDFDRISWS